MCRRGADIFYTSFKTPFLPKEVSDKNYNVILQTGTTSGFRNRLNTENLLQLVYGKRLDFGREMLAHQSEQFIRIPHLDRCARSLSSKLRLFKDVA